MICEKCKVEHDGGYGSGRFCSSACARSFSTSKNRLRINEKVSQKLKSKKQKEIMICENCSMQFQLVRSKTQKTCSRSCSRLLSKKSQSQLSKDEFSKKMSLIARMRYERGDDFGWRSRKNLQPSYPEQLALRVLNERGVIFEREARCGRYFIDFAFYEQKIAVEVDGQQHKLPERAKHDERKDAFLRANGWTIYRIKFPEENVIQRMSEIIDFMRTAPLICEQT